METNPEIAARLDLAIKLAREVGQEALRFWEENGTDNLGMQSKGTQDFVTEADKAAERTIRAALADNFPNDGFIGEESGGEAGDAGFWVVDPIDGTSNYLRGLRHWGVSIAYVEDGQTQVGVIHDSPTDRIYSTMRGAGAKRDGTEISASRTSDPTLAMGILGASRRTPFDLYLRQLQALYNDGIEHRKIGAAAIGIVRVAEGVADFYYEKHLNSWDALAALLIAEEAGAIVATPPMRDFVPNGGEVLCSTPALNARLERILLGEI